MSNKLSKPMRDALLDMLDGRVLARDYCGWGGNLNPMEIEGKKRRVFLGNVKRITMNALHSRELIEIVNKPSVAEYIAGTAKIVYTISEKGREAVNENPAGNVVPR